MSTHLLDAYKYHPNYSRKVADTKFMTEVYKL